MLSERDISSGAGACEVVLMGTMVGRGQLVSDQWQLNTSSYLLSYLPLYIFPVEAVGGLRP